MSGCDFKESLSLRSVLRGSMVALIVALAACTTNSVTAQPVSVPRVGVTIVIPSGWSSIPTAGQTDPRVVADFSGGTLPGGATQGATLRAAPAGGADFDKDISIFLALQRLEHPGLSIVRQSSLHIAGTERATLFLLQYSDHGARNLARLTSLSDAMMGCPYTSSSREAPRS